MTSIPGGIEPAAPHSAKGAGTAGVSGRSLLAVAIVFALTYFASRGLAAGTIIYFACLAYAWRRYK